jgi:hypothetical protein
MYKRLFLLFFGVLDAVAVYFHYFEYNDIVKFFSFFTVLSNILATFFFFYFGFTNKPKYSSLTDKVFGATTVYMITAAVGYWVFLRNFPVTVPWTNNTLHVIMPFATLVGWIILLKAGKLPYKTVLYYILFPIAFLVYSLVRGALTGWYPYNFLDPHVVNGYPGVFMYIGMFTAMIMVVSLIVIWLGNTFTKASKK